jgi:large subunit ribosomal protein L5
LSPEKKAPVARGSKVAKPVKATQPTKVVKATKPPKAPVTAAPAAGTTSTRASAAAAAPTLARSGLRMRYIDEVVPTLQREFNYANPMQIPRLDKIVVNIGLGEAIQNAKALDAAVGDLARITGQKPIVTRAKRSIAQFRLRTGMPIGAKVTLRGLRMYDFLERTVRLALPRIRDFRGITPRSFDGRGNFTIGLREQLVYPEIDYDKIDRLRGLEISIVTTAKTDEEGRKLLELLGMPFQAS